MNTALMGGHIDLIICSLMDAAPMLVAGKIRGLAISSDKRMAALPEVPTFTELGIGESLTFKRSLWAPAKTPSNIVGRILKAVEKAIQDPEFIRFTKNRCCVKWNTEPRNKRKKIRSIMIRNTAPG